MRLDLGQFIATGEVPGVRRGSTRAEIIEALGSPEIDEAQRRSYPAMMVYGDLEFRLRDGTLRSVALSLLDSPTHVAPQIELVLPSDLSQERIEGYLVDLKMGWRTDEIMSSPSTQVLVTAGGVHLLFDSNRLVRAVAEYVGV